MSIEETEHPEVGFSAWKPQLMDTLPQSLRMGLRQPRTKFFQQLALCKELALSVRIQAIDELRCRAPSLIGLKIEACVSRFQSARSLLKYTTKQLLNQVLVCLPDIPSMGV